MRAVALAAVAFLVPSCSQDSADDSTEARSEDYVKPALLAPSNSSLMAAFQGTLWIEGRCLYITGPNGEGTKTLPAFHVPGLKWDDRNRRLVNGSAVFSHSQVVFLTGGEWLGEGRFAEPDWLQAPDPSCDKSRIFMTGRIDTSL